MEHELPDELEFDLADLFGSPVDLEPLSVESFDGTTVVTCNMSYTRNTRDPDSPNVRIRQTAVILDGNDLDLPEFVLSPTHKGLVGMLFAKLGGFGDINFSDSPRFSREYHLHGWAEKPVRILFTPEVRKYFADQLGWSVRAKGKRLVIFRHNQVCDLNQRQQFVADSLVIMEHFQAAERGLDQRPDIRRDVQASDVASTADRMGGIAGAILKRQINKFAVSRADLAEFLRDSTPRAIPSAIKRQVMGDNLPLLFVGLMFLVFGVVFGSIVLATVEGSLRYLIAIPSLTMFPLIGGLMFLLTLLYRRNRKRILRNGKKTLGKIIKVERTGTEVNNQVQHRVTIEYDDRGHPQTGTCHAYSLAVTQAKSLASSGEPVTVLIDPANPERVVCAELLVTID